jgi:hypothetical protein
MSTSKRPSSILESLNLSGLKDAILESKSSVDEISKAAAVAPVEDLGPLAVLAGQWTGTGFNIVELPNRNLINPSAPVTEKFVVIVNATTETLQFNNIGGEILNRGNSQPDLAYFGLHYLQQISDAVKGGGIHLETGLFLNIPSTTDPLSGPTVARLGSIPHGDSLLAQGNFGTVMGPPIIDDEDTTPLIVNEDGSTTPDDSQAYIDVIFNTPLPAGIPAGSAKNPNLVLKAAIKDQKIIKTTFINLSTKKDGGIVNIPFVKTNANAVDFSAIFWIEEVSGPAGNFLQLQYTQKLFLDFKVFNKKGDLPEKLHIKWPHVSVATLRLNGGGSTA